MKAAVVAIGFVFGSRAFAQQAAPVLRLGIDNDLFAIRGAGPPADYDYTHGTHLSFSWRGGTVALAQEIYTPRHNEAQPVAGDRPYADETRILAPSAAAGPSRLVAATIGGTLGTMQRSLRAGVQSYLGVGSTYSPTADEPLVARPGHWYLIAAFREDIVFYDGFIELPPRDAAVTPARRRLWVPEATAGIGWRTKRFAAEYRYVVRGREYEASLRRMGTGRSRCPSSSPNERTATARNSPGARGQPRVCRCEISGDFRIQTT